MIYLERGWGELLWEWEVDFSFLFSWAGKLRPLLMILLVWFEFRFLWK